MLNCNSEIRLAGNMGVSGQILTSQGAGVIPIWTSPVAGLVQDVSAVNTLFTASGVTSGPATLNMLLTRTGNICTVGFKHGSKIILTGANDPADYIQVDHALESPFILPNSDSWQAACILSDETGAGTACYASCKTLASSAPPSGTNQIRFYKVNGSQFGPGTYNIPSTVFTYTLQNVTP